MRLTDSQQWLLGLLKQFGCLRDEQIINFLKHRDGAVDKQPLRELNRTVEALRGQLYRPLEGYVCLRNTAPNTDLIDAADLVLDYRKHGLLTYTCEPAPFAASFSKQMGNGSVRFFSIAVVHKGHESLVSALMRVHPFKSAVIFLMDEAEQQNKLLYPAEHYFAVRENAGFRYAKGVIPSL